MPNWAYNTLKITCENPEIIARIKADIAGKNGVIDFEKIMPTPAELLDRECESLAIVAEKLAFHIIVRAEGNVAKALKMLFILKSKKKNSLNSLLSWSAVESAIKKGLSGLTKDFGEPTEDNKNLACGKRAYDNLIVYGFSDWYDWRCYYWGTKWNAVDPKLNNESDNHLTYAFDTAWDAPWKVISMLSAKYKEAEFTLSTEYEDTGSGGLEIVYSEGKLIKSFDISTVYYVDDNPDVIFVSYDEAEKEAKKLHSEDDEPYMYISSMLDFDRKKEVNLPLNVRYVADYDCIELMEKISMRGI